MSDDLNMRQRVINETTAKMIIAREAKVSYNELCQASMENGRLSAQLHFGIS
ncbi:MAG: hypothetical protein V1701_05250 [Planctomycetota bacterium]